MLMVGACGYNECTQINATTYLPNPPPAGPPFPNGCKTAPPPKSRNAALERVIDHSPAWKYIERRAGGGNPILDDLESLASTTLVHSDSTTNLTILTCTSSSVTFSLAKATSTTKSSIDSTDRSEMRSLLASLTSQLTGSQLDLVYNLYNLIVQTAEIAAMMERTWVEQEVGRASVARIGSWQRDTTTSEVLLSYHAP